jgi:hypothetical protein
LGGQRRDEGIEGAVPGDRDADNGNVVDFTYGVGIERRQEAPGPAEVVDLAQEFADAGIARDEFAFVVEFPQLFARVSAPSWPGQLKPR